MHYIFLTHEISSIIKIQKHSTSPQDFIFKLAVFKARNCLEMISLQTVFVVFSALREWSMIYHLIKGLLFQGEVLIALYNKRLMLDDLNIDFLAPLAV